MWSQACYMPNINIRVGIFIYLHTYTLHTRKGGLFFYDTFSQRQIFTRIFWVHDVDNRICGRISGLFDNRICGLIPYLACNIRHPDTNGPDIRCTPLNQPTLIQTHKHPACTLVPVLPGPVLYQCCQDQYWFPVLPNLTGEFSSTSLLQYWSTLLQQGSSNTAVLINTTAARIIKYCSIDQNYCSIDHHYGSMYQHYCSKDHQLVIEEKAQSGFKRTTYCLTIIFLVDE